MALIKNGVGFLFLRPIQFIFYLLQLLIMKSDNKIQNDVINELKRAPYLKFPGNRCAVKNSIVTLSGQVDSCLTKLAAEKAPKKVSGVKTVAEDVQVGISHEYHKTDTDIATAVLNL